MNDVAPAPILADLQMAPRLSYGFLWADYAELICLTSEDGLYSPAFLRDRILEEEDIGADTEDEDQNEDHGLLSVAVPEVEEIGPEGGADAPEATNGALDERIAKRWNSLKRRLEVRRESLGENWPFAFEGGALERRYDPDNALHRLYVALLLASALRFCPKDRRKEVESSLEEVGYHLIRGLLPDGWEVRPFGAHQTLPGAYRGTLQEKYSALGQDIHAMHMGSKDMFDPRDTGDGGLDVVAWHPFMDSRGNIPVLFAQCGCSPEEWEHKQYEAAPMQQESKIVPHHPAVAMYIMPHDLRATNGDWERKSHLGRIIMVDRSRIVKLATRHGFAANLQAWPFVHEAVTLNYAAPR